MNVYDFDKTIYIHDSSVDFIKHCVFKYPACFVEMPRLGLVAAAYGLKLIPRDTFKQKCFKVLRHVPDLEKEVDIFWDKHQSGIKKFYLNQKRDDDLIISASPDFIIDNICNRLGIESMSSSLDPKTGLLNRPNCFGEEKVKRFREAYTDDMVEEFYSDSYTDTPMARLAKKAYIVKGEKLLPWKF